MAVSAAGKARRALVAVLRRIVQLYTISVVLSFNSCDAEVLRAYRKVILKAHPDKGGNAAHFREVNEAKEAWDQAKKPAGRPKRSRQTSPPDGTENGSMETSDGTPKRYDFSSEGVMLTYNGVQDQDQWNRFLQHVRSSRKAWGFKHWCASLEACQSGTLHIHLMLQFHNPHKQRFSKSFAFETLVPNASVTDYLGNRLGTKKLQNAIDRGMFYVFADKNGTQRTSDNKPCVEGDYLPCWTSCKKTYSVNGRWPADLYKAHKLSDDVYDQYLHLCRDGVVSRKRNHEAVQDWEARQADIKEMAEVTKRIRENQTLNPGWPTVPEVTSWLNKFNEDALRYPILFICGPSHEGKTEYAKSLFKNPCKVEIGYLQHFPSTMRTFSRQSHDGIILDDIKDCQFIVDHQEKLQGKYDILVEFSSTLGGTCAYTKYLFRVPIVCTANNATKNLDFLSTNDWLCKADNCVVVRWPPATAT